MTNIAVKEYENGFAYEIPSAKYLASTYHKVFDGYTIICNTRENANGHNRQLVRILGQDIPPQDAKKECMNELEKLLRNDTMNITGKLQVASVNSGTVEELLFISPKLPEFVKKEIKDELSAHAPAPE